MLERCIAVYTHLSSTVYELARYWSEIATFFPTPLDLTPLLGVFPLEFREKVWTSEN